MSKKKKPKHDEIVRSAFENSIVAKEFFEMHLPPHIQNLLSFETLKMEKGSFVDIKNLHWTFYFQLNFAVKTVTYFYY